MVSFRPLFAALRLRDLDGCIAFLDNHPEISIPKSVIQDIVYYDALIPLYGYQPVKDSFETHKIDLLRMAYTKKDIALWRQLVKSGCDLSTRHGDFHPLHLVRAPSCPAINVHLAMCYQPMQIPDYPSDYAFIKSIIMTPNHRYNPRSTIFSIFANHPTNFLDFTCPKICHELLNLSITNEKWDIVQWFTHSQKDSLLQDRQSCQQLLDGNLPRIKDVNLTQVDHRFLVAMGHLIMYDGINIMDTVDYYRFLTAISIRRDDVRSTTYYDQMIDVLHYILEQNIISIHGKQEWNDSVITPLEASLKSHNYDAASLLIKHGAVVPSTLFHYFDSYSYPAEVFTAAVNAGYKIHINTFSIAPFVERPDNGFSFFQMVCSGEFEGKEFLEVPPEIKERDPLELPPCIADILLRDQYAHDHLFWSTIHHQVMHYTSQRKIFIHFINTLLICGRTDAIDLFVQHGFNLLDICGETWRPFHLLIEDHHISLQYLLDLGVPINQLDDNGCTPLQAELWRQKENIIRYGVPSPINAKEIFLIMNGGTINLDTFKKARNQLEPFYRAVYCDNIMLVKLFLDLQLVCPTDLKEGTPLNCVHSIEMAKLLVDYGYNVNDKSQFGTTPLMLSANLEIAQFYIDQGANVDGIGKSTYRYHSNYCRHRHDTNDVSTQYLLPKIYKLLCRPEGPGSPLYSALNNHQWELAKLLVENKANLNYGHHPIIPTCISRFNDVNKVMYLIDHGADIFYQDPNGMKSLNTACLLLNKDIIRLLLNMGASSPALGATHTTTTTTTTTTTSITIEEEEIQYDLIWREPLLKFHGEFDYIYDLIVKAAEEVDNFEHKCLELIKNQRCPQLIISCLHKRVASAFKFFFKFSHIPFDPVEVSVSDDSTQYSNIDCGLGYLFEYDYDRKLIRDFINRGANVNAVTDGNFLFSRLVCCCSSPSMFLINMAIDAGADVNPKYNIEDDTPLITAVKNGSWDAAFTLLNHGADVTAVCEESYGNIFHIIVNLTDELDHLVIEQIIMKIKQSPTYTDDLLRSTDDNDNTPIDYVTSPEHPLYYLKHLLVCPN